MAIERATPFPLNFEQQRAVETVEGRVLILAGAGSGKTRVLAQRMAHMINHRSVPASSILGLTFTNKAANEMRQRIGSIVDSVTAKEITLCTFHSFCLKILRRDIAHLGYTPHFTICDEHDIKRLLEAIARDIIGSDSEIPSYSSSLSLIIKAKSLGISPEELSGGNSIWHRQFTRELYRRLLLAMRAYNVVDFDQLLLLCVELFEKEPSILLKYQELYRYIMIDEYQDTNPVQYRLAELLSRKYGNLCVVGDDDQSIYGWRGAEMRYILDFENATLITLEQNYRSTTVILQAANSVISNNSNRHPKALWSNCGEGQKIDCFAARDEIDEAVRVVERIAKLRSSMNLKWADFAILYRSNALSRQLEAALLKATWRDDHQWRIGIPYHIHGGMQFYERREVKDLMAYLRVIANPLDQSGLLRIINQPRRGIGEHCLDRLTSINRRGKVPLWTLVREICAGGGDHHLLGDEPLSSKSLRGLREFFALITEAQERFAQAPLVNSMEWLIERIAYRKAIDSEVKSEKMRDFKWENVKEFVTSLQQFEEQWPGEERATLLDFIGEVPLNESNFRQQENNSGDRVNLLTFHSAKGLQFPVCFLVALEEEIIPHRHSLSEGGGSIEEERRLLYVAITRAMRHLTLSRAKTRMAMGKQVKAKPSRFLSELPRELLMQI